MHQIEPVSDEQQEFFPNLPRPEVQSAPVGPDNPPWNGWIALGVFVASVLLILMSGILFVTPYLAYASRSGLDQTQIETFLVKDPIAVLLQMLSVIPAHILTLLMCWFVITKNRQYRFTEVVGWKMGGFRIWHAIVLTLGFYALTLVAVLIFGKVEHSFEQMLSSSKWIILLVAFLAIFSAPIVEEAVYRGIMYSAWQRAFGRWAAIAIVTILFTVVHGAQYSQGSRPDIATLSVLFLLSLMLTVVRAKTESLLPAIVLHTVFNAFQSIVMILATFFPEMLGLPPTAPESTGSSVGLQ